MLRFNQTFTKKYKIVVFLRIHVTKVLFRLICSCFVSSRQKKNWNEKGQFSWMQQSRTKFLKPGANESKKTLNKCETRNKTVFHTRLRHPETINSVPLNCVLRIKQTGV